MNKLYTVYVLGPMRGKELFNFPAFDALADRLWDEGYNVRNPAQMDREAGFTPKNLPSDWDWNVLPTGFDMRTTIKRDIAAILECNAYVCLDGWENSTGATAEQKLLAWLGATRLDWLSLRPMYEPVVNPLSAPEAISQQPATKGNPKDVFGLKKTPLRLVPWVSVVALARVMKFGAEKYGEANWRDKKPRTTVYVEAAFRHLLAYLDGQNTDPESGESHLAHVMANCAILLDAEACDCLLEDRKPTGAVIRAMADKPAPLPPSVHVPVKPFSVADE